MLQQIRPQQLPQWLSSLPPQARPLLLDVREPWELQLASVQHPGLDVQAMPMHTVPARWAELDRSRPVLCLCHHGGRSMQVAAFLQHQGFDTVANLAGGIDAWSHELDACVPCY